MLDRRAFARASLPLAAASAVVLLISIWQRWYVVAWVAGMAISASGYALWSRQREKLDGEIWHELEAFVAQHEAAAGADEPAVNERVIALLERLVSRAKAPTTRARLLEQIAWRALRAGRVDDAVDAVSRLPPSTGTSPVLYGTLYIQRGHVAEGKRMLERTLATLSDDGQRRWALYQLCEAEIQLGDADAAAERAMQLVDATDERSMAARVVSALFEKQHFAASSRLSQRLFEVFGVADDAYNVACALARGAADDGDGEAARAQRDEALSWLAKAIDSGYADAAHLDNDSDLDALRQLDGFEGVRELLAGDGYRTARQD